MISLPMTPSSLRRIRFAVRIPLLTSIFAGMFLMGSVFQPACEASEIIGISESSVLEKLGNPIAYFESGGKKCLQYPRRRVLIEWGRVVRDTTVFQSDTGVKEVIVHNPEKAEGFDPLGLMANRDVVIRGGRFSRFFQEDRESDVLRLSGADLYLPRRPAPDAYLSELSHIRKAYLRFQVGWRAASEAVLILHTAEPWRFGSSRRSPGISVYAVRSVSPESSEMIPDWADRQVNWKIAYANAQTHGADLEKAVRLTTQYFPRTQPGGIGKHIPLRFELGNLDESLQIDGSVTLIVAHSDLSELTLVSKDSTAGYWFKPRLILKQTDDDRASR